MQTKDDYEPHNRPCNEPGQVYRQLSLGYSARYLRYSQRKDSHAFQLFRPYSLQLIEDSYDHAEYHDFQHDAQYRYNYPSPVLPSEVKLEAIHGRDIHGLLTRDVQEAAVCSQGRVTSQPTATMMIEAIRAAPQSMIALWTSLI